MAILTKGSKRLRFGGSGYLSITPPDPRFIIKVDTTITGGTSSDSNTMIIPTVVTSYDCSVDWGDGTTNSYSGSAPSISHTYTNGGEKVIKISGTFPKIYFLNAGDKLKLLEVVNWGIYGEGVADQSAAFYGCSNLTSIADDWKLNQSLTNGNTMFSNNSLTSLPDNMTLSGLIDGSAMFDNNSLISLPANMTLSVLENGGLMFSGNYLISLPGNMILPLLAYANNMFQNNSLTSLPTNMTLASLITGVSMFYNNSITSLPDGMILEILENGSSMFREASLTSLPTNMTLTSLTNGSNMFQRCSLTSLPSMVSLSSLENASYMFYNNSITSLHSGVTLSSLSVGTGMFQGNTIATSDYSGLLVRISENNVNNGVNFHGGNSNYNLAGEAARNELISRVPAWSITDGVLEI